MDLGRRNLVKLGGGAVVAGSVATVTATAAGASRASATPGTATAARGSAGRGTMDRKLIEYGWDMPGPLFLRDHLADMQDKPFDGVVFNLHENRRLSDGRDDPANGPLTTITNPFSLTPLTAADLQLDVLRSLQWGRFSDNFLSVWTGWPKSEMNWFDDNHWRIIRRNAASIATAVKAARATGIFFDEENYGHNQWAYTAQPGKTRQQVMDQVRKRGAEFVRALQGVKPDIKIYCLNGAYMWRYHREYFDSINSPDVSPSATYVAFMDGMLDALGTRATIIDGGEAQFYFDETTKWRIDGQFRESADYLLSAKNADKYARTSQGSVVYSDLVSGNKAGFAFTPSYYPQMTAADFEAWTEHNVYQSLLDSEEYVWIYNEKMQWWTDNAYPGLQAAITRARTKFDAGTALGFDLCKADGFADKDSRPAVVSSPAIAISGLAHRSTVKTGTRVLLTLDGAGEHRVEWYDNGHLVDASFGSPYLGAITLGAGVHTLVARMFLDSGRHVTSNPIVVRAR